MTKANKVETNNGFFLQSFKGKKWTEEISVPFLPKGYEKNVQKYVAKGMKTKFRNKRFEKILKLDQSELKRYAKNCLKELGYNPILADGYLYAEGEIPVLLLAHLDTVHKEKPRDIVYKDNFMTSPQGIGGDDRCGVYAVLRIVKSLKCHVLFSEDEEKGGIGASKFSLSKLPSELEGKIKYCIELDRRGEKDAVFYECDNDEFRKFIESTGYFKEAFGSFSDICTVAPVLDCSAVNLSIGYFGEHTKSEYIDLRILEKNILEAKKIIQLECDRFIWIETKYSKFWSKYSGKYSGRYSYYDDWYDEEEDYWYYGKSLSDRTYEDKTYAIFWDNWEKSTEIIAGSLEEAVGFFLMDNPSLCYKDLNYADEVD